MDTHGHTHTHLHARMHATVHAYIHRCMHAHSGPPPPPPPCLHSLGAGLRAALSARSYKHELIVMGTTASRLLTAVQAVYMLRKLGYGHFLMMSVSRKDCSSITLMEPSMGCAWDRFVLPVVGRDAGGVFGAASLYNTRWACGYKGAGFTTPGEREGIGGRGQGAGVACGVAGMRSWSCQGMQAMYSEQHQVGEREGIEFRGQHQVSVHLPV